jgi:3-deoxy-D-manno-octulosonate 8-phosphate phosphatase (KDO 8-P phosphatase)
MSLYEKALEIKALVLDVDGVLTDGRIGYGCGSSAEIKFFNVKDGHGIKLAMRAGLQVGILSGRASEANRARAAELKLDFVYENVKDKLAGFKLLLSERGLQAKRFFT